MPWYKLEKFIANNKFENHEKLAFSWIFIFSNAVFLGNLLDGLIKILETKKIDANGKKGRVLNWRRK